MYLLLFFIGFLPSFFLYIPCISSVKREIVTCFVPSLNPQHLEQYQAYNRCSVNLWEMGLCWYICRFCKLVTPSCLLSGPHIYYPVSGGPSWCVTWGHPCHYCPVSPALLQLLHHHQVGCRLCCHCPPPCSCSPGPSWADVTVFLHTWAMATSASPAWSLPSMNTSGPSMTTSIFLNSLWGNFFAY